VAPPKLLSLLLSWLNTLQLCLPHPLRPLTPAARPGTAVSARPGTAATHTKGPLRPTSSRPVGNEVCLLLDLQCSTGATYCAHTVTPGTQTLPCWRLFDFGSPLFTPPPPLHTHTHTTHTHKHTYTHTHTHIRSHTHKHTYIHTQTHTCTFSRRLHCMTAAACCSTRP
jgi:hypothetical protein